MADDWAIYSAGLQPNSLGLQKGSPGTWKKIHGDGKSRVEGRFWAGSLISSKQDSITVKLEYTGIPIFSKSLKPFPLSALHLQCVQQLKKFEGRKLNEQEKAAKLELSGIKSKEEAEHEREETRKGD